MLSFTLYKQQMGKGKINEDLSSWRVERVNRVSKGFYKSEAVELVR